jgi:hypothetical protein
MMRIGLTVVFWLAVAGAAAALEARMTDGGAVTWTVRTDGPSLQARIIIRNASGMPRRLVTTTELTGRNVDGNVPAEWTRVGPLAEGNILPAGGEASYTLSAALSLPGIYETAITGHTPDTNGVNGEVWRIAIEVQRAIAPIAAPAVTLTASPSRVTFGMFGGVDDGATTISLRNAGSEPIEFGAPTVFSAIAVEGEAEWAPLLSGQPRVTAGNCASPLPPGAACAFALHPGALPGPGEYRVGIGLEGSGGGWVEATQVVSARRHWAWAFVAVVMGVVVGWVLQAWRTRGRPAAEALLVLAPAADRLRTLAPTVTDSEFMRLVEGLAAELQAAEGRIRRSGVKVGEVERLAMRVQQLVEASGTWHAFQSVPDAHGFLTERWQLVVHDLNAPWEKDPDVVAFRTNLHALGEGVKAWPNLKAQRIRSERLQNALRNLGNLEADGAAFETLAGEVQAQVAKIDGDPPSPDSGEGGAVRADNIKGAVDHHERKAAALVERSKQRLIDAVGGLGMDSVAKALMEKIRERTLPGPDGVVDDLQAFAMLWREYHDVSDSIAAASGSVMASKVDAITPLDVPGMPQVELPPNFLLPPPDSTPRKIRRWIDRNDFIMTAIVAAIAGAAGVAALWATDPTWGGIASLITAFVGGAASRIVVGDAS